MKCSNCNSEVKKSDKKCSNCGATLIWDTKKGNHKKVISSKRYISIAFIATMAGSFFFFLIFSMMGALVDHSFNFIQATSVTFIVFSSICIIAFSILILVNKETNKKRMKNFLISLGVAVALVAIFSTVQSISRNPYQSANGFFEELDYENAIKYYQIVIDENKNDEYVAEAKLKIEKAENIINILKESKKPTEVEKVIIEEEVKESLNDPPIAYAGEDIKCNIGDVVTLDGSNSTDANGDKLSYIWNYSGGEFSGKKLSFEVNEPKTYFVSLTVSDGKASDSDMVKIIVEDLEKIAEEVEDEAIEEIPEVEVSEEEEITEDEEPEPEETVEEEPIVEEKPDEATLGEKQAALKALDYLAYTPFSYSGLVEQLKFEGYTHEEAVYGVDKCGADWNEQAALKALDYLNYSSFSRNELIAQLEYEGFTRQQAEYGVQAVGY